MPQRLAQDFYQSPCLTVAEALLGTYLVKDGPDGRFEGEIIETEAYCGPDDRASHARWGPTPRARIMFGPPGFWYVYLIYGTHHCLNITADRDGYPAAVLIRSVRPTAGFPEGVRTDGPGRLCRAYGIDRRFNGTSAFDPAAQLWIEARPASGAPLRRILTTPRIGIPYAGEYRDKPWRFVLAPANAPPTR